MTAFDPATGNALSDQVVGTLRKAIVAGAYAPGDHLPEARTAAQLGVSRVPVREAMLQLEREGLLIFDKRGAALVRELSAEDFEELFSARAGADGGRAGVPSHEPPGFRSARENIARTRGTTKLLELTLLDIEFRPVMRAARHSRLLQCWRKPEAAA
jgi:DNA-binding transcriptional regulator YhcF (GntR family)